MGSHKEMSEAQKQDAAASTFLGTNSSVAMPAQTSSLTCASSRFRWSLNDGQLPSAARTTRSNIWLSPRRACSIRRCCPSAVFFQAARRTGELAVGRRSEAEVSFEKIPGDGIPNRRLGGEDFVHTCRRLPEQSSNIDDVCFRGPVQPARCRAGFDDRGDVISSRLVFYSRANFHLPILSSPHAGRVSDRSDRGG